VERHDVLMEHALYPDCSRHGTASALDRRDRKEGASKRKAPPKRGSLSSSDALGLRGGLHHVEERLLGGGQFGGIATEREEA
jgi:hypothetical protein